MAACGGGGGAASAPAETVAAETRGAAVLFLLHSNGGTISRRGGGKRAYRVELVGLSEQVIAFSHRPDRRTNHATLEQFLGYWATSDFDRNPPNASFVLTANDGSEHILAATLERPRLDAAARALTFDATLLPDLGSGGVSLYPPPVVGEGAREFAAAAIFVDANYTVAPPRPGGAAPRPGAPAGTPRSAPPTTQQDQPPHAPQPTVPIG